MPTKLWVKGQSGNPKGRPPVDRDFVAWCKDVSEHTGQQRLIDQVNDPTSPHHMRALELLLAYAHGRPPQRTELTGEGGGPLAVSFTLNIGPKSPKMPDSGALGDATGEKDA